LTLLGTFDRLTNTELGPRPVWLPLPSGFEKSVPNSRFPTPLSVEQGRRLFGAAVAPMFVWYFGIQTACAVLALATAWPWGKEPWDKVHRVRTLVLTLALVTLGISWLLDGEVNARRQVRSEKSDAVLVALRDQPEAPSSLVEQANA